MLGRVAGYLERTAAKHFHAAQSYVAGRDFPADDFSWSPLSRWHNRALKRGLDIAVGVVGTSALIPAPVIVAPLIKLDSAGPVFYRQLREGKDGAPITIWKFRSMVANADRDPAQDSRTWAETMALRFGDSWDPKVTRMGRTLRRYGIDEFPQFWSILKGEITLFGPRALILRELDQISGGALATRVHWRNHRRRMPPSLLPALLLYLGMNPNEVGGKTSPDEEMLVTAEMYYLGNWSLSMDLGLAFRTLAFIFSRKHG